MTNYVPKELPKFQFCHKFKEQGDSSPNTFRNSDFWNIFGNISGIPQMRLFHSPNGAFSDYKSIFASSYF
jgi:hypothetical protein